MKFEKCFSLGTIRDELRLWTQLAKPEIRVPGNVLNICEYGFTEVLNNVIEHSQARNVIIRGEQEDVFTVLEIEDDGVGVFAKIRAHFDLDSDIHALIELVKGKLTVAPETHSGEGLFFASKMFDRFVIESGELSVVFEHDRCEAKSTAFRQGTLIHMQIANNSQTTAKEVFDRFCDVEDFNFYRTRFFISLAALEGSLISRSQAKRIVARFESFEEVELDFGGVDSIGQAFADELLRVWPLKHPQTKLVVSNANESVRKMINHIKGRTDLPQP